jgi:hypothetical protein
VIFISWLTGGSLPVVFVHEHFHFLIFAIFFVEMEPRRTRSSHLSPSLKPCRNTRMVKSLHVCLLMSWPSWRPQNQCYIRWICEWLIVMPWRHYHPSSHCVCCSVYPIPSFYSGIKMCQVRYFPITATRPLQFRFSYNIGILVHEP